jgi:3-phytase
MNPWHLSGVAIAAALALSCGVAGAQQADGDAAAPLIPAKFQTVATASGEANAAVLVRDASRASRSRIIATAALGGLEVYDLAGKRTGVMPAGEVAALDVAYDIPLGDGTATVVAAIDTTTNSLRLFTMKQRLVEVGARPLPLGFAAEGICLFRNPLDSALYAFVVGDGGEIDQQVLYATAAGKLDARQVRRINVPSTLKQCAADGYGQVYASEEAVGIWRFSADPEADVSATLVDAPRLGHIEEETGGVALYDGTDGTRWLIASDVSAGQVNVYDRASNDAFIGAFKVAAPGKTEAIDEPGPLFASADAQAGFAHGMLLVTDEDDSNYKALSIDDIAAALQRKLGPARPAADARDSSVAAVSPLVETVPVESYGDAADDPAIWANPVDPARSLVIATDKKAGMHVYDMQGKSVHFLPDGKMNNVDLREGFELGGEKIVLVTASNRTDKSIAIYRLDTTKRELVAIADGVQPTGFADPYGLCMYRSARGGRTYVFINGDDTRKRQWELVDAGNGHVRANLVREMGFDSQTEGCVADDASAALYVNEEDVALWRMSAEPDGGDTRAAVDRVDSNPAIRDDLEGVGLYDLGDGRGYIVVSSQGNDTYAVYRREGKQEYLGSFAVVADPVRGIDGISETDGLEVTSRNLGPGFEHGAMIAQDGRNVMPIENQNYKYVPWEAIARALELEMREN